MASLTVGDMRDLIINVYKGPAWKEKVRNMSDRQVMAIYFDFCEKGRFDKPSKKHSEQPSRKEKSRGFYLDEDDYAAEQLYLDLR